MDKIMILGAGEHQLHLIERAKERGFYTIAVSPDGDYPGLKAVKRYGTAGEDLGKHKLQSRQGSFFFFFQRN